MNTEMLYELYEITEKNDAPDLATVGMPMLLKKHPEITHEEAKEMREFKLVDSLKGLTAQPPPYLVTSDEQFYLTVTVNTQIIDGEVYVIAMNM